MPHVPHWYTLRKESNERIFEEVVKYIRTNGYDDWYYRKKYKAFNFANYKYWTMGSPVNQTTVINRKRIVKSSYDDIAPNYDSYFGGSKCVAQDKKVFSMIDYQGGSLLDIGCGTGLVLDNLEIDDYTGIDPSLGMLKKLLEKHLEKKDRIIHSKYEDHDFKESRYDYIVALYGTASYLPKNSIGGLKKLLNKGGKIILMFYKPKYIPVTYKKAGHYIPHNVYTPTYQGYYKKLVNGFENYVIITHIRR